VPQQSLRQIYLGPNLLQNTPPAASSGHWQRGPAPLNQKNEEMNCQAIGQKHGRFRWISKPFKRWAFAKGEEYTQCFSKQYSDKYVQKFLRKQLKIAETMQDRAKADGLQKLNQNSSLIAAKISECLAPTKKRPPRDLVCASIREICYEVLRAGHDSHARAKATAEDEECWVHELTDFSCGLGEALDKNVGLDHSKVVLCSCSHTPSCSTLH
jgi:hypothetical protein